ncbi:MAG: arsenate reductase [Candidatus Pelagisphaera sp.]|jgi:arsenate reductase
MSQITIYHNSRCSKSRCSLGILRDKEIQPTIVEYLKTPPSSLELADICKKLNVAPSAIIRSKEMVFKDLGLSLDDDRSAEDWFRILADNPNLIERPIIVKGSRAVIGRPPENVLKLL